VKSQIWGDPSPPVRLAERNDYRGYERSTVLNGKNKVLCVHLTFENKFLFLRTRLQQECGGSDTLRALLGVANGHAARGWGFLARGLMRPSTKRPAQGVGRQVVVFSLQGWIDNQSTGLLGVVCLGYHFRLPVSKASFAEGCARPSCVRRWIGTRFLDRGWGVLRHFFLFFCFFFCLEERYLQIGR